MELSLERHPWVRVHGRRFVLTLPEDPSAELLQAYSDIVAEFYALNQQPFAWVVDGSRVKHHDVERRGILGELLARHRQHLQQHCVAMGLVIRNPLIRGVATAVFWIAPPKYPNKIFATLDEANAWADGLLAQSD